MKQIATVVDLLRCIELIKKKNKTIGFVPTMGSLHEGHDSLLRKCQKENDISIVSIYVNPSQFNCSNDFKNYPRNLDLDIKRLNKLNCDIVFSPSNCEISKIKCPGINLNLGNLNKLLEAEKRPGHFKGVAEIVSKLFKIICPNNAYFGEKDLQQLLIIKKLTYQYFKDIKIISCETVRAPNGLAKSSRNKNLNNEEKLIAGVIFKVLNEVKKNKLTWNIKRAKEFVNSTFNRISLMNLEYFEIIDSEKFSFIEKTYSSRDCYAVIAVNINNTRLIDNLKL
jgi:pantoate--beta-alanine ligase